MNCPLCNSPILLKRRSIADASRGVYFCTGCPMVYLLLRDHEAEAIRASRQLMEVIGGRPAFRPA